ncbi:MAG: hypothetical protein KA175_09515 [Flavobacteriales bacterium]|nr:hypothetical protein [Flavobacteriales bacterium]MBP6697845.1 hypothetical protein [Flavobacteriales bacterium]
MHTYLRALLLLFVIVYLRPSAGLAQSDRIRAIQMWFTNLDPAQMQQRAPLKCKLVKRNVADYGKVYAQVRTQADRNDGSSTFVLHLRRALNKDDLAQRMHLYLETARRSPAWAFDGIVMITFADGGTTTVNMGRVELGSAPGLSHYWDRALSSLESE